MSNKKLKCTLTYGNNKENHLSQIIAGFTLLKNKEGYFEYAKNDESIYKNLSLAVYYAYKNDKKKSIEHLKLFAKEDNFQYWVLLFLKLEPLIDNIKNLPEFNEVYNTIETNFWHHHNTIKKSLEAKELLN